MPMTVFRAMIRMNRIGPRPHQGQSDGDQNVEQIEQGTYMSADDLSGRLGDGGRRGVAAPPSPAVVLPPSQSGREKLDQVPYRFASLCFFKESISLFLKQFINCG